MLALLVGAGCAPQADDAERLGSAAEAIEAGVPYDLEDLRAVLKITKCTATYVGNRTVLTAAHCVLPPSAGRGCSLYPGGEARFNLPDGTPHGGQTFAVVAVNVHPQAYEPFAAQVCCMEEERHAGLNSRYDVALMLLDGDPVGIEPLPVIVGEGAPPGPYGEVFPDIRSFLDLGDSDPSTDAVVTIIGFGEGSTLYDPDGDGGVDPLRGADYGTVRFDRYIADSAVPDCFDGVYSLYEDVLYQVTDGEGPGPRSGDSGSPLLAGSGQYPAGMLEPTALPSELDAVRHVIGVHSRRSGWSGTYPATWDPDTGHWLAHHLHDIDGDGVPNDRDNCVLVPNSGQDNCNRLSEEAHQGEVLGDACDPVPCPDVLVHRRYDELDADCPAGCQPGVDCHPSCPADTPAEGPDVTVLCTSVRGVDMAIRPLLSAPRPLNHHYLVPVEEVPTTALACVEQPSKNIACNDKTVDIDDSFLNESDCWAPDADDPPAGCAVAEGPLHRYHRQTFLEVGQGNGPDPNADPLPIDYDVRHIDKQATATWQWDVVGDFDRWQIGTLTPLIEGVASADDLNVSLWIHAGTQVGQQLDIGTGRHLAAEWKLANHYALGPGDKPLRVRPGDENGCIACLAVQTDLEDLFEAGQQAASSSPESQAGTAEPSPAPLPPYLVWRPRLDPVEGAFRRFDATHAEADILLQVAGRNLAVISGSESCGGEIVTSKVGTALRARLRDPVVSWARLAEPFGHQGPAGSRFPLAVALSAEGGSEIIDTVTSDGRLLMASGDRTLCPGYPSPLCGECPSRRCNPDGSCCDLPCHGGSDCPTGYCDEKRGICDYAPRLGSPHARDYQAVLSSVAGGLFVVGGEDLSSGEPTGEIWFSRLEAAEWSAVPLGFELGRVLAATYSFSTGDLYVLDELGAEVRLWAVRASGPAGRLFAAWPHHPAWDRHWLLTDRDGGLLVASARSGARIEATVPKEKPGKTLLCHFSPGNLGEAHTVSVPEQAAAAHLGHGDTPGPCSGWALARIDTRGGAATVDGVSSGPEPLWLPPLVDGDGYTFVHHHPEGGGRILRRRLAELALVPATLEEVGWRL